ncbi:MAG: hypothetical protein QXK37_06360 [Candidatus Woesearchaeota archaeon]
MEMPIRIMITLFVAIIVGVTVITFSKQMIEKSKMDLERSRPGIELTKEEEEKIIELNLVDTAQIIDLITECYNRHHLKTFEKELCFIAIGKEANVDYNRITTDISSQLGINVTSTAQPNDYAVKIYFSPMGETENIEISR